MRIVTATLLALTLLVLSGCSAQIARKQGESFNASSAKVSDNAPQAQTRSALSTDTPTTAEQNQVSLAKTDAAKSVDVAMDRKIIRNANITLELAAPADGQRKIASIAEAHGGFVVTSEVTQHEGGDKSNPETIISIVVRLPAAQFGPAVEEIRGIGNRIRQEKITGQDVTEEYLDLEARIRSKKALEAQFLEIMKQAHKVSDALEVQSQLAEVRTEIERLEGRRRYLENQSSLSTITVTLQPPTPIVSTSGFSYSVKEAIGEGVDVAAAITLFLIRLVISLIPVGLLIFLPLGLLLRFLIRRARRFRLARELAHEPGPVVES